MSSKTNGLSEVDENWAKKLMCDISKVEFMWNKKHKDHMNEAKKKQASPIIRELLENGTVLRVLQSQQKQYAELTLKCLELSYYIGKNKRNRMRMVNSCFIPGAFNVFRTFFTIRRSDTLTVKICLHAVALMRILTRTKVGREQLAQCNALPVLRQAVEDSLNREHGTSLTNQLDTIICAICIRCLPLKELPLAKMEFPITFVLPLDESTNRVPAEDASESDEDNAIPITAGPLIEDLAAKTAAAAVAQATSATPAQQQAQAPAPRGSATPRESFSKESANAEFAKFFIEFGEEPGAGCKETSPEGASPLSPQEKTSPTQQKQQPQLQKLIAPTLRRSSRSSIDMTAPRHPEMNKPLKTRCNSEVRRIRNSSDPNPESLNSSTADLQNLDNDNGYNSSNQQMTSSRPTSSSQQPPQTGKNCYYDTKTFIEQSNETRHVNIFRKFAYPDYTCAYPCLPLQPFKEYPGALLRTALSEVELNVEREFEPRVVYDFDELLKTERDSPELTNNDENEVGIQDPNVDHLKFEARFENGNLRKVTQVGPYEYEIVLSPDINQLLQHYMWFYFHVSNMEKDVPYVFKVVNFIKSQSLMNTGMQPCVFSVMEAKYGRYGWVRCGTDVVYYRNNYLRYSSNHPQGKRQIERCFSTARFTISFRHSYDICYLAWHFPYTYSSMKASLIHLERKLRPSVYYRKDIIGHSLAGNPIFMLTITAPGSAEQMWERESIFLSSRVHPGESNGNWMMHGCIEYLLSDAPGAQAARELFVFKIVPYINPDGPINGSHRCSLVGQDLNRQWASPSPILHPCIYACRQVLLYLGSIGKRPLIFIDFHGHSRKQNVFMYGCNPGMSHSLKDQKMNHNWEFYLIPELLEDYVAGFSLKSCDFKIQKNKESAGRVVAWRFGIQRAYTIEASYGGFDRGVYAGFQNNTRVLIEVGEKMIDCFVYMKEWIECNRTPTKKFESDSDDSGFPDT